MNKINTRVLINFLTLPEDQKIDLLAKYDTLSRDEQLKISDVLWEAFATEYDYLLKSNLEKISSDPNEKTDPKETLYQKAVRITNEDINNRLLQASEQTDLSHVRKSMEKIVKEINASEKKYTP